MLARGAAAAAMLWCAAAVLSSLIAVAKAEEGAVLAADDVGGKNLQDWRLEGSGWAVEGIKKEGSRLVAMDKSREEAKGLWWFTAPGDFLSGDAAHAYNGWLQYTLGHFEYEDIGEGVMDGYDVMLISTRKKLSMGLNGVFQPPEDSLSAKYQVRLEETFSPNNGTSYWQLVTGKLAGVTSRATKNDLIQCLGNLREVRIRGSYYKGVEAAWLRDISVLQGKLDKGGRYPGMMQAKQPDAGPEYTIVNGVKVFSARSSAPSPSASCCTSKTCVGRDRYELVFDRPGCVQSADMQCDERYKRSNAAAIIKRTDEVEGRKFVTPGTKNKLQKSCLLGIHLVNVSSVSHVKLTFDNVRMS